MHVGSQVHELINAHDFKGAFSIAFDLYKNASNSIERRQVINPAILIGDVKFGMSVLKDVIEQDRVLHTLSDTDLALMGALTAIAADFEISKSYFEQIHSTAPKYTSDITVPVALSYLFAEQFKWVDLQKKSRRKLKQQSKKGCNIAKYLVNEISENEFLERESSGDILATRELCKKYYYVSKKAGLDGNKGKEIEFRKKCLEIEGRFLEIEYFIAHQESIADYSDEIQNTI